MADDTTDDGTEDGRTDISHEPPKLTIVGGDSSKGGGKKLFGKGNKASVGGQRVKAGTANVPHELDLTARRVIRELLLSARIDRQDAKKGLAMTAGLANSLVMALRFRHELHGTHLASEEVTRLHAAYVELQAKFARLKQGLLH